MAEPAHSVGAGSSEAFCPYPCQSTIQSSSDSDSTMTKKPRILIAMHYMELGGAESALLGMLQAHDPERADIDLFLYDHRGDLLPYIPIEKVNLLPMERAYSMLERPMMELVKSGFWKIAYGRLMAKIMSKREKRNNVDNLDDISIFYFVAKFVSPFLPKINPTVEYDLAISFLQPHQYILDKVRAKKKLAWLHTDYSKVYVPKNEENIWGGYDIIGSISEEVGNGFLTKFPALRAKILPIENILSSSFIRQRAQEEHIQFSSDHLNFLTIGRYCYPKKMEEIPAIVKRIIRTIPNLRWYIIGYGVEYEKQKILDNIAKENVADYVILLGKQCNPYPYIKACDFYLQPSRYEGKSITVREAQILGKPVIITAYPTASSQIKDNEDGFIVPMQVDACAQAICELVQNPEKKKKVIEKISTQFFGNENEIEKIYKLV